MQPRQTVALRKERATADGTDWLSRERRPHMLIRSCAIKTSSGTQPNRSADARRPSIGGYRAPAVTSDRHGARLAFPSADSTWPEITVDLPCGERASSGYASPTTCATVSPLSRPCSRGPRGRREQPVPIHIPSGSPASARTASNATVQSGPRSLVMNVTLYAWSPRPMIRLRACWAVHSAVGCRLGQDRLEPPAAGVSRGPGLGPGLRWRQTAAVSLQLRIRMCS
jgi:hypothetical protein